MECSRIMEKVLMLSYDVGQLYGIVYTSMLSIGRLVSNVHPEFDYIFAEMTSLMTRGQLTCSDVEHSVRYILRNAESLISKPNIRVMPTIHSLLIRIASDCELILDYLGGR